MPPLWSSDSLIGDLTSDEVRRHPSTREVQTPADLRNVLRGHLPLSGVRIQDLDLHPYEQLLLGRTDLEGLVVLGGHLSDDLARHLRLHGALVFPSVTGAPINPYRSRLYQADDLYAGIFARGYRTTPDARAYAWSQDADLARDTFVTLLRAIHDDSMTDALTELLQGHTVVGVMGGHALERGTQEYAAAATMGHALADAGRVVLTGGGPGAMEAANLGAFVGDHNRLAPALRRLSTVPSFRPSIDAWAEVALEVREDLLLARGRDGTTGVRSVGIPTWFYGHEPPNVFCGGIAKYFSNALREDGLLARCTGGLVVLPGAAGTVQEIFQAVTPLYYAAEGAPVPPLVLVGHEHWTEVLPVWPALRALGLYRPFGDAVHLVDTVEEAAAILLS